MALEIQEKVNLSAYTSWKVGGDAEFFVLPENEDEILEALNWAKLKDVPVTYIGGGTNILVSDKGVKGLVVCLKKMNLIEDLSDESMFRIKCGAGVLKMKAMRRFLKEDLTPALFLSGLPGDVAGGVVMNAGVSEKEVSPKEFVEIVESFKVIEEIDGAFVVKNYQHKDIDWFYRRTTGWGPGLIFEVVLVCSRDLVLEGLKKKVKDAQELRASKQPLGEPSCGSVFRNPYEDENNIEKRSAGFLIEKVGLKGYQYGGAEISRKHANFIVNKKGSTALDIHCAVSIAREKVHHEFGVVLHAEFKYVGDWEGLL